jgi:hypothetical protein
MAFKINAYAQINNDTTVTLGTFANFASLPSGAPNGSMAYNSGDDQLYYKKTGTWSPITAKYGSVYKPAASAAYIYSAGDSNGDGSYYIASTSGTIQTYCDMTNGQFMLCATIDSSQPVNSVWAYAGGNWSTSSPVNEASLTTLADSDAVNRLYYEFTATTMRFCLGTAANALQYAYSGTAKSLFTGSSRGTGFGRSAFMSWFQTGTGTSSSIFDNQPNCNAEGFNISGPSYAGRLMISMNNEGDCSSNDSAVGFGTYTNGDTGGVRNIEAGGHRWNPDARYGAKGMIFVK